MYGVVSHVPLNARWADKVRELGEEGVDRGGIDYLDARDPRADSLGGCGKRLDAIQQPVVATVHQKSIVCEEVGSDQGCCDVGNHKPPREISAQSQVEGERQPSIGLDCTAISCVKIVIHARSAMWEVLVGVHAEIGAGVDEKSALAVLVCYKEAVGTCSADVARRWRLPR
jgi:hypothetical protein